MSKFKPKQSVKITKGFFRGNVGVIKEVERIFFFQYYLIEVFQDRSFWILERNLELLGE